MLSPLKGTLSKDILLQVFFMNHLPPSPNRILRGLGKLIK
jgi:hypothetical protein